MVMDPGRPQQNRNINRNKGARSNFFCRAAPHHAPASTPLNNQPDRVSFALWVIGYRVPYTLYPIPYILYHIPYTIYPIPYTLYPVPYTLYPIPYTLYPIPYTLYPIPYTLYPIPYTLYPIPYHPERKTHPIGLII